MLGARRPATQLTGFAFPVLSSSNYGITYPVRVRSLESVPHVDSRGTRRRVAPPERAHVAPSREREPSHPFLNPKTPKFSVVYLCRVETLLAAARRARGRGDRRRAEGRHLSKGLSSEKRDVTREEAFCRLMRVRRPQDGGARAPPRPSCVQQTGAIIAFRSRTRNYGTFPVWPIWKDQEFQRTREHVSRGKARTLSIVPSREPRTHIYDTLSNTPTSHPRKGYEVS